MAVSRFMAGTGALICPVAPDPDPGSWDRPSELRVRRCRIAGERLPALPRSPTANWNHSPGVPGVSRHQLSDKALALFRRVRRVPAWRAGHLRVRAAGSELRYVLRPEPAHQHAPPGQPGEAHIGHQASLPPHGRPGCSGQGAAGQRRADSRPRANSINNAHTGTSMSEQRRPRRSSGAACGSVSAGTVEQTRITKRRLRAVRGDSKCSP
jgi:hypothetical protein